MNKKYSTITGLSLIVHPIRDTPSSDDEVNATHYSSDSSHSLELNREYQSPEKIIAKNLATRK